MSASLSSVANGTYDIVELSWSEVDEVDGGKVVSNVSYAIGWALTGASVSAVIGSGGTLSAPAAVTGLVGVAALGIGAVAEHYGY